MLSVSLAQSRQDALGVQLPCVAYWVSELMLVCYYTCGDGHALTMVGPPIISIVNIKRVETV